MTTTLKPPVSDRPGAREGGNVFSLPKPVDAFCQLMATCSTSMEGMSFPWDLNRNDPRPKASVHGLGSRHLENNHARRAFEGRRRVNAILAAGRLVSREDFEVVEADEFLAAYVASRDAHNIPDGQPLTVQQQADHAAFAERQAMMDLAMALAPGEKLPLAERVRRVLRGERPEAAPPAHDRLEL